MSTLNHDTELEEILTTTLDEWSFLPGVTHNENCEYWDIESDKQFNICTCDYKREFEAWPKCRSDLVAAFHTYLYRQTLELIGEDYDADTPELDEVDEYKAQLRKAAAERWGQ
jgi:hypothetical protein